MVKVLIADDESILCNGIKDCIDWESLGASVVATACDGEDALEKISLHLPDICLLDVRMPFVDGLQVAKLYLEKKPDGITIMITGYDEFAYAQSALNKGAFGYILKPVNEDELLATVQRAVAKIKAINEKNDRQQKNDKILEDNRALLREAFLKCWLMNKIDYDTYLSDMAAHSVDILPQSAMLFLCLIEEPFSDIAQSLTCRVSSASQLLEASLADFSPFVFVQTEPDLLVAVYSRDGGNLWLDIPERLYQALKNEEQHAILLQKDFSELCEMPEVYAALLTELEKEKQLSPIANALKQYAEQNFRNTQISLKDFARTYNTTSSYLSRLFRQEVGVTFVVYLSRVRIYKSIHYLNNPRAKICDIAQLCGYSSQHYYCESFRRIMGMSPSEYRKSKELE